jgi:hypothetical protein
VCIDVKVGLICKRSILEVKKIKNKTLFLLLTLSLFSIDSMSRKRKAHEESTEERFATIFRDFLHAMSPEEKERAFSTFKDVMAEEEERFKWDTKELETLEKEEIPRREEEYKVLRRKKRKLQIELLEVGKDCDEAKRLLDLSNGRRSELLLEIEGGSEVSEVYLPLSPSLEGFSEDEDEEPVHPGEESEYRVSAPEPLESSGHGEETEIEEGTTVELRLLQIPTYTFRGALCFHCGAHDESLMTKNDGDDWDMFIRGERRSRLWLAAKKRLTFPSTCTCFCMICNMSPEYCLCQETFVPHRASDVCVEDYVPKTEGKTKYTYVPKCMKTSGILKMSLHDAILRTNTFARSGDEPSYKLWYESVRAAWKRYVHHVNTVDSLETYVYLAYVYSETVRFDTYCAFMYCDFTKGSRGRNHCSAHRRQIMGKETARCPWMVRGKERFEEEK